MVKQRTYLVSTTVTQRQSANHVLISRKDCYDINLNFTSNINAIIGVFKLGGKFKLISRYFKLYNSILYSIF